MHSYEGKEKRIVLASNETGASQNWLLTMEYPGEMIGKYERDKAVPFIPTAKELPDAFEVYLDYLVAEGVHSKFDKKNFEAFA